MSNLPFLYYVLTSADTETKSTYSKLLLILTNRMIDKSELHFYRIYLIILFMRHFLQCMKKILAYDK